MCGCATSGRLSAQTSVRVEAWVEQSPQQHPILAARFTNIAGVPLAFSETFGYGSYAWVGVRVRSSSGRSIPYPAEIDRFSPPPFRCLQPGEELVWRIDLLAWQIQVGGEAKGDTYSFDLNPGTYEVQVQYTDGEDGGKLARCRRASGVARSEWVEFEVLP